MSYSPCRVSLRCLQAVASPDAPPDAAGGAGGREALRAASSCCFSKDSMDLNSSPKLPWQQKNKHREHDDTEGWGWGKELKIDTLPKPPQPAACSFFSPSGVVSHPTLNKQNVSTKAEWSRRCSTSG